MDEDAQKIIDAAVKQVDPPASGSPPGPAEPSSVAPPPATDPQPVSPAEEPGTPPQVSQVVSPSEPVTAPTPPPSGSMATLPSEDAATSAPPDLPPEPPPEPAPVPPGQPPSPTPDPPPASSATSDLMDSLIHPGVMPVPADVTPAEQSMAQTTPEKSKKKKGGKGILIATLLVLLLTLPLAVFFISNRQQQIADTRSRAAVCCEGGVCGDGSTFGGDPSYPYGTCDDRNRSACDGTSPRGSGGVVSGGGQCGGTAPTTAPTTAPGGGASCGSRAVDGQYVCLTIAPPVCKQCVNGLYRDAAIGNCAGLPCNPDSTGGSTPTPTPTPGGSSGGGGWGDCSKGDPTPCGSCSIKNTSNGSMTFGCELNCGGSASSCPGGSAGNYSIAHRWFHCRNKDGGACGPGNSDFMAQGDLGGSGPWTIVGQHLLDPGSGTFPSITCGRVQVDVQMNAGGTNVAGGLYTASADCTGGTPPPGGDNPEPTPTPTPAPQCTSIKIYDAGGADITAGVRDKTRKLKLGETITLGTPKGSAAKAHFRIQGITEFTDNDTAITTATEYRLKIQIPTTITQAQGNFEVEIFVGGQWR